MHYYDKKYPYFQYPYRDVDGSYWIMYSVPVNKLAEMYQARLGRMPASFFDCGAAVGELVRQAARMGMDARGIDIKQYPIPKDERAQFFRDGRIQIKDILQCEPIRADLVYCNGTLTYMNENTLPQALNKFQDVGMLISIHNTTEDVTAAAKMGWRLTYDEPRLIRSNDWWLQTFEQHGFDVDFDAKYKCFCAVPRGKTR